MAQGRLYSEFELNYIRERYAIDGRKAVAEYLGRDPNQIGGMANRLGVNKPIEPQPPHSKRRQRIRTTISATGPAIDAAKSDATYEDSIRASTRQLGEAVAKLAAKMQRQAARERRA